MKKDLFKCILGLSVFTLLLFGCQKEISHEQALPQDTGYLKAAPIFYCGQPETFALVAGQNVVVGKVTVGNDDKNIYVTFAVMDDWWLSNTKVFLGNSPAEIPITKTGNPIRGKFTQDVDHNPFVKTFTHVLPLPKFVPGQGYVLAIHSDVLTYKIVEDVMVITRKETAWAKGGGTFPGNAWGWWCKYIVQSCCPDHVVVFWNVFPWESSAFKAVLYGLGFDYGTGPGTWEYATIADMGTKVLNPYRDLVIILNDQPQGFYNSLAANKPYFENFVNAGGRLIWEAADMGWNGGSMYWAGVVLPLGITYGANYDGKNLIPNPALPLVAGLTSPLYGSAASHESFGNLPPGSIVYCTDSYGKPTLFEFKMGNGKVIISGQTLEYGYSHGQGVGPLLYRIYAYMTCHDITPDMVIPEAITDDGKKSFIE